MGKVDIFWRVSRYLPVFLCALYVHTSGCSSGGSSEQQASPPIVFGGCSGGGQIWTCSAGSTSADVQGTVDNADDGAMILFERGTYNWSGTTNFSPAKSVTLICVQVEACTVNVSDTVLGMKGNGQPAINNKVYRISGFVFNGGNNVIWYTTQSDGGSTDYTMTNIRIDHNTFIGQSANSRILQFGDIDANAYYYGRIDHNSITNSSNVVLAEFHAKDGGDAPAGTRGSVNNMFFEDNTMMIATMSNAGAGCIDSTGSPSIVWRFNITTNCLLTTHGTTGGGGIVNFEIYNNQFVLDANADASFKDCFRAIHSQGAGEMTIFNNIFVCNRTYGNHAIGLTHYRSATSVNAGYSGAQCDGTSPQDGNREPASVYRGYPCKRQPGRDVNGMLHPIYVWNNLANGSLAVLSIEAGLWPPPEYVSTHIQLNRDVYNAVSVNPQSSHTNPFNGATGMGFGTLANRPTTCTTGPEALDTGNGGVAYWATDAPNTNWRTDNGNGNDGGLYICTAPDTWSSTPRYMPYTYPLQK